MSSNGSFWPCEEPGLTRISGVLVDGLIRLARHFFSFNFAKYQPLRSQYSPVISCLLCHFEAYLFPSPPPPPSTPLRALVMLLHSSNCSDFLSCLVGNSSSTGSGLKGNGLKHFLCKFHMHVCYPWQVILT